MRLSSIWSQSVSISISHGEADDGIASGNVCFLHAHVGITVLFCLQAQFSPAADDSYIAGYAAAMLEHEFNVTDATIQVENGMVTVTTKTIGKVDRGKVLSA